MQSIVEFFGRMNDISFPYVVLRNFENLPFSVEVGGHSDLDLLVYDLEHFKELFPEAKAEFAFPRVRYKMPLGKFYFYMDVRYVGDNYYPELFEQAILDTREYHPNGFYVPNPVHFRIALSYHAAHHKNENIYQRWIGDASVEELLLALKKSEIGWVEPTDPTVGRFNAYWKGATSIVNRENNRIIKRQISYKDYDLLGNEIKMLKSLDSIHFPKVYTQDEKTITIEDCGDMLTEKNAPENWKEQLLQILRELKAKKIRHNDVKLDNLMVKNGIIHLIDWGWASREGEDISSFPKCLGYPNRPSWGPDDDYAMRKVIKQLEYKMEEECESLVSNVMN